jgi:hypothetical protein
MKNGFVVEFNVRGKDDGRAYPSAVIGAKRYGVVFDDLTEGQQAGTVTLEKDIEGWCSEHDVPIIYDRAFVILP